MRVIAKFNSVAPIVMLLSALAACQSGAGATLTPTRALSGPTLAASPTVNPLPPTEAPPDVILDGRSDPTAAALPRDSGLPPLPLGTPQLGAPQSVQLAPESGVLLDGELYQQGAERLPGVLMVGAERAAWGDFPAQVQDAGFTVLVIELREDTGVSDFVAMLDGLNTGLVDPNHIAVVGAGRGADLALRGCAQDRRCDALVLLSPLSADGITSFMAQYNPRPLFIAAAEDDADSFPVAQTLDDVAGGEHFLQPVAGDERGAQLLPIRPNLAETITGWIARQLGV